MKNHIIIFLLFLVYSLNAQKSNHISFKDGDRICFIGNSITYGGGYHNFLQIYNATRFPNEKIAYFNCGIPGDVADGMINRFESDILIHKPTHAFLMTGMNDINRVLYFKGKADEENLMQRKSSLDNYYKKTELLAEMLIANNIEPIFITPSIYDQTAEIDRINDYGANDALALCAEHIRKLAEKYNAPLVDFYKMMGEINAKAQLMDPTFTIVGPDRIHPGDLGHLVMAFEVIKIIEPSIEVSRMVVNARKSEVEEASNCAIEFLKTSDNVEFKVLENALPFPIKESLLKDIEIVPLKETINNELLIVHKLKRGNYSLFIDEVELETFSKKELKKGINLANYTHSPQYQQAIKVSELVNTYHKTQDSIRVLKFIEYRMLNKNYSGPNTIEAKKEFLLAENAKSKGKSWYEWDLKNIKKYFLILPKEKDLWVNLKTIRDEIYTVNKPNSHTFKLVKSSK